MNKYQVANLWIILCGLTYGVVLLKYNTLVDILLFTFFLGTTAFFGVKNIEEDWGSETSNHLLGERDKP